MSYATLLVHLQLGHPNTSLLKIAGDLAERLDASVIGIVVCQPMLVIYNDGYVPPDLIEQDRRQIDDEMKAAEAEFRAAFGGRIKITDWRAFVTSMSLSALLANEARAADLVISGVDSNASMFDLSRHVDVGDLVMRAGRPCLVVPNGIEQIALDHVMIGWKDTGETRRAVRDALPLLRQAARVTIAEIALQDDLADARARLQDVAGWLRRHGIDSCPLATLSTGDDAGQLTEIMQEQAADLLVAGVYGHSRVREWVLGGVTRDLLLRADRLSLVSH